MNTKIGWIIVGVVAVIIIAGAIFIFSAPSAGRGPADTDDTAEYSDEKPVVKTGASYNILMKGNEFMPKELTVNVGDEVVFVNEDDDNHWPASDLHPTHLLCPGFDSLTPIKKGQIYAYVFEKAETCPMHDHIMPRMRGKIIIK